MVQTGRPRTKRPDGRLLSVSRRKKLVREGDAAMEAKDLKITKVGSKDRRTREIIMDAKEKTKNEKLLRSLRKKMKGILALQEKERNGVELDVQQLEKLELYDETKENLDRLEGIMAS